MSKKVLKNYYFDINKCIFVDEDIYTLYIMRDYKNVKNYLIINETVYNALKEYFSRIDLQLKLDI